MRKFTKLLTFISLTFIGSNVFAQATTSSPYSAYGVGSLVPQTFAQGKGMGNITSGLRTPDNINISNPASYTSLVMTNIDLGLHGGVDQLNTSSLKQSSYNFSLDHFAIGFPMSRKMGGSLGIIPFSNSGYNVGRDTIFKRVDTVSGKNSLFGEGGYSQVYFGTAYQVAKNLSIGVNIGYLFGSIKRTTSTVLDDPYSYNSRTTLTTSASGFLVKYGAQYSIVQSPEKRWTIGYFGSVKTKVNTKQGYVFDRYLLSDNGSINPVDTISYLSDVKGNLLLPTTHTVGFTFNKANKLIAGADFDYQQWTQYTENGESRDFKDMYGVRLGAQYTPDIYSVSSYLKRIEYRAGINYYKSYLNLKGQDINEMDLTLGVGLPMSNQFFGGLLYTGSKLNLGVQLGTRGTTSNGLIKERYCNLFVGFTLNDRWFIKRRFD
ncbi:hypothetical protein C3K47_01700 [Solitalea longa]|uniref:Aromatic hydrocarbon degradation protein n=1 Tax=Solitalea longa TaxID=2079460 RepID=A0A2S5A9Q1_9SPHI|nr:hypothetical protein [Solitalea longa]POY39234.1 hypothetical protein C3K47_01700 [Solitalea longa]